VSIWDSQRFTASNVRSRKLRPARSAWCAGEGSTRRGRVDVAISAHIVSSYDVQPQHHLRTIQALVMKC
jgi:hypothetical protein